MDEKADEEGVARFAEAMAEKLNDKRLQGRGGWNREDGDHAGGCSVEFLRELLTEHIAKGDPVDIANFAMMIWNRTHPLGLIGTADGGGA